MALGKPVVTTNAGGPREIVAHEETGLLVPPGDVSALTGALASLLNDRARARGMGAAGRRRYEALFTAPRMARETRGLYEKIVSERSRRGVSSEAAASSPTRELT